MARTLIEMKAQVLKALGHPTRLLLVESLAAKGEQCVCELAELARSVDRTTLSKHLTVLKAAGIVSDRKEGLRVFYSLSCPCAAQFLACIEQMVRDRVREDQAALEQQDRVQSQVS